MIAPPSVHYLHFELLVCPYFLHFIYVITLVYFEMVVPLHYSKMLVYCTPSHPRYKFTMIPMHLLFFHVYFYLNTLNHFNSNDGR